MKLELHFTIDDKEATYSWIAGVETQTCHSKVGQDSFLLFSRLLILLQESWRGEVDEFNKEQLIRKTIQQLEKEKSETSAPKESKGGKA